HPHPVADGAQIVAKMKVAGGLDAGNDAHRVISQKLDRMGKPPHAGGGRSEGSAAPPSPGRPAARHEARALTQEVDCRFHRGSAYHNMPRKKALPGIACWIGCAPAA